MRLSQLKPDESAKILRINLPKPFRSRLDKMGLKEGEEIRLLRSAPLNSPLQYKIQNFYMALRKEDADNIDVELL